MSRVDEWRAILSAPDLPPRPWTVDVERDQADLGNGEVVDFFTLEVADADGMSALYAQSEEDPSDLAALIAAAPTLLRDLVAVVKAVIPISEALERPCWYDHHDYCQAHWLDEKPCPVEALDAAIADLESGRS